MLIIDGVEIDAELSSEPSFDSEITDHPVEQGGNISDHVRPRPIELRVEGVVSDTPLGRVADARDEDELPSDTVLSHLTKIRDKREPVTVETDLRVYRNMVLQSLSVPRDERTGEALRFRATFKQIRIVETDRAVTLVEVPREEGKQNLGHQPSEEAGTDEDSPEPTEEDKRAAGVLHDLSRGESPEGFFGFGN